VNGGSCLVDGKWPFLSVNCFCSSSFSLSLLLCISVSDGFLRSYGGVAVMDSDARRFSWQ